MTEPNEMSAAELARSILSRAETGALGTNDPEGYPFVSLVSLATGPGGRPLLLLSNLSAHSRHLARDARSSLLVSAPATDGDPLAGARLTLSGRVVDENDPKARGLYLAAHPEAEVYVDFADFTFRRFEPVGGYLVAGFGRIVTLGPEKLILNAAT